MPRRATKIVATLGPASSDPALLEAMIRAGVNVVRLNFSHGKAQDHVDRARLVREASQRAGREVAIMADLQGPKIRVGKFAEGKVMLEPGEPFVLDASRTELGDIQGVGLDYKELPRDVKAGDVLVILESMKMEIPLTAPRDGVVREVRVQPGSPVRAGQRVVVEAWPHKGQDGIQLQWVAQPQACLATRWQTNVVEPVRDIGHGLALVTRALWRLRRVSVRSALGQCVEPCSCCVS